MRGLTVTLNGGPALPVVEYRIDAPEYDYVRAVDAVTADPAWTFTDHAGHEHRWGVIDRGAPSSTALPTLQRRRINVHRDGSCGDGDCEGWTDWAYNCRLCGALVVPSYMPDYPARTTGIPILRRAARHLLLVETRSDTSYEVIPLAVAMSGQGATRLGVAWLTGRLEYRRGDGRRFTWLEVVFT